MFSIEALSFKRRMWGSIATKGGAFIEMAVSGPSLEISF